MFAVHRDREHFFRTMIDFLKRIMRTPDDPVLFGIRIVLGAVMFAHGAQKALGWFGGTGLHPTLQFFGTKLGIPAPLALLAIGAEFLGGLGLTLGLLGRVWALGVTVNMVVAVLLVHMRQGFFMNWWGTKAGEGFEYHLLAIALAAAVLVRGAGAYSLDRVFGRIIGAGARGGSPQPLIRWPGVHVAAPRFHVASVWMRAGFSRR